VQTYALTIVYALKRGMLALAGKELTVLLVFAALKKGCTSNWTSFLRRSPEVGMRRQLLHLSIV
jgi:hypothetical protein